MLDTLQQEMPEQSGWENLIAKEKITFDFIDHCCPIKQEANLMAS
jgi:hypothetical protein